MRTFRELVRLFALRLGQTRLAKLARFASLAIALGTCITIAVVRASDGPSAPTAKLATSATRVSMWLVALAIALAASHQRAIADRRDGIEMLALSRGFDGSRLMAVRAAAASFLAFRWMLVPVLAAAVATMAASGTVAVLGQRALLLVVLVVFALVAGSVLGALGAAADGLSPRRGRSLFLIALLLSALVAEIARDPAMSITGGLLTVLNGLLHLVGAGKLA
jgi:hypothetical protein